MRIEFRLSEALSLGITALSGTGNPLTSVNGRSCEP